MTPSSLKPQIESWQRPPGGLRERVHEILYEANTPAGKVFDITLIVLIRMSVAAIMLGATAA